MYVRVNLMQHMPHLTVSNGRFQQTKTLLVTHYLMATDTTKYCHPLLDGVRIPVGKRAPSPIQDATPGLMHNGRRQLLRCTLTS